MALASSARGSVRPTCSSRLPRSLELVVAHFVRHGESVANEPIWSCMHARPDGRTELWGGWVIGERESLANASLKECAE